MQYGGVGPLVSTDVLPHYCNVAICVFKKCRVKMYRAKRDEVAFLRPKCILLPKILNMSINHSPVLPSPVKNPDVKQFFHHLKLWRHRQSGDM